MNDQNHIIRDQVRTLITKTCDYQSHGSHYYSFQKELLKYFFKSIEVIIDYDQMIIHLWNSKPLTDKALKLYDINEAVSIKVNYTNLEETLKGCIEKGDAQARYYKSLLLQYQAKKVKEKNSDIMSA